MDGMNAVRLIYEAAMRTPVVPLAGGKAAEYRPAERGHFAGICWLCGESTDAGHPRRKVIKPTFTDAGVARAPWSDVVCEACAWAISYRSLRNYSILASPAGLRHPTRTEIREVLLEPPEPPFALCVAVSGQKWLHLKARVALSREAFPALLEETPVIVHPAAFAALLGPAEELYAGGFTKAEIASGRYLAHRIQAFGIGRWEALEARVAPARGSRFLDLALHVARKEGEAVADVAG